MPDLFDSGPENSRNDGTQNYTMVQVKKTNKDSKSDQVLTILSTGEATLMNYHNIRLIRTQLSDTEIQAIQNAFIENKFFFLEEAYRSSNPNEFQYTITFRQANVSHTIVTGYTDAPAELKKIIIEVDKLAAQIAEWNLELTVTVNKTTLTQGDTLIMRLSVHNKSAFQLRLSFETSQIYKFWIVKSSAGNPQEQEVVWELESTTGSNANEIEQVLQPGETRIYQEFWHGKNKSGVPLIGKFLVYAELLSTPGGIAAEVPFEVSSSHLLKATRVTYGDSLELSVSASDTLFILPANITFTMIGKNISNSRTITVPIDPSSYDLVVSNKVDNATEIFWQIPKKSRHNSPGWPFLSLQPGVVDTVKETWQIQGPLIPILPKGLYHIQAKLYDKEIGTLKIKIL